MNRISDISSRIQKQSDEKKRISGSLNPMRFENDLVSALNNNASLSGYQSSFAKSIAEKCAVSIVKKVGSVKNAFTLSKGSGGGAAVLSPIYKRFMCSGAGRCNGDPKTDLVILSQLNGRMKLSLKKEGSAQIATAQVGEANAVITSALGKNKEVASTIRSILTQTLSKENYYSFRETYSQRTGDSPEKFDYMLSSITGLKTGNSATPKEMRQFSQFLEIIGVKEKITAALREYISSPSVQKRIFKEFASGEKRYIPSESDRSANWFMVWSESGSVEIEDIDEFVNSHYGSFRMNIRDRGNESGGSIRLDIRDSIEFKEIEKMLLEEFDMYCLTEGVLDTTIGMIRTAGATVASLYKKFVDAVKATVSLIAAMVSDGIGTLLEYFGLETTEMSYSW